MTTSYRRGPLALLSLRAWHLVLGRLEPVMGAVVSPRALRVLGRVPGVPVRFLPRLRSPARPWEQDAVPAPPDELRTVPGVRRDPAAEDEAARERPLYPFFRLHADAVSAVVGHMWPAVVAVAPRLVPSTRRVGEAVRASRESPGREPRPERITEDLRARAAQLGLSAVGITAYDPRYALGGAQPRHPAGDTVVVAVQEQNYDATQRIPAERSEQAALSTYAELQDRLVELAGWLRERGYTAEPEDYVGESMFIPYAVAAGLGQLGLNGQLLTPHAGSRCRINVLHTDAPLHHDAPVDYGIEGVCDRCQACVRRCPVGAIPAQRHEHRGITKAKLNTKRCLPLVMQVAGCSVCMKVCPVQAYGLPAVLEEFGRSGEILGTRTDGLEGYDWPPDGRHYPPGEKPRVPEEVVRPPGYAFDADRTTPPPDAEPVVGT